MNMVEYWPNAIVQNYDGRVSYLYTSEPVLREGDCFKQFDCWKDIYDGGHIVTQWIEEVVCGDVSHKRIVYHEHLVDALGNFRESERNHIERDPETATLVKKLMQIAEHELEAKG